MALRRTDGPTDRKPWTALLLAGALAACASTPEPAPAPEPEPAAEAAVPAGAVLAPRAAAGTYQLRTDIQRQGGSARRGRAPATTPLTLSTRPATEQQMGAPATTYSATVQITGYTRGARGRAAQSAAWWPAAGDSVIVQFPNPRGDFVQLRGRLQGRELRGELWYLSMETGATFQLGTFSATKR